MILIGLGSNIGSEYSLSSLSLCHEAVKRFLNYGIYPIKYSRWYLTSPIPPSSQNFFINGVISVVSSLGADSLVENLHRIEYFLGRRRQGLAKTAARPIDLDLLVYSNQIMYSSEVLLPHPRFHLRSFVLYPLRDVAPGFVHPLSGLSIDELIARNLKIFTDRIKVLYTL